VLKEELEVEPAVAASPDPVGGGHVLTFFGGIVFDAMVVFKNKIVLSRI